MREVPLPEPMHGFYASPMYAPDQMQAYADARVRAALEAAIAIVERGGMVDARVADIRKLMP